MDKQIAFMIFILGGLWAAFALLVGKEEKHMCDTLGRLGKDRAFFEKWGRYDFKCAACAPGFTGRWEKKNKVLRK